MENIDKENTEADKIVKAIKDSSKLSHLEKFSIGFNFLIGIVTLVLSIVAINLTRKYGENTDQITQLSTIAQNQRTEMTRLIAMVNGLDEQNKLTQEQNIELKSQGKTISDQFSVLLKELAITQNREKKTEMASELEMKSHIREIDVANSKLYNIFPPWRRNAIDKYTQEERIEVLNKTKSVIDILATNTLIILNDSLPTKLKNLVSSLSLSLDFETMPSGAETQLKFFRLFIEKLIDFQISLPYYRVDLYKKYKMH